MSNCIKYKIEKKAIELLNRKKTFFDKNSYPLEDVLDIAKVLNEIGGYDSMLIVCKGLKQSNKKRELEFAWNGIGTWMA